MNPLDIPLPALLGQLTLGLINGAFYALLSLGLAVIFGMLRVVNFAHGAQFTLGAYGAWVLLAHAGVPYWGALVLSPLAVALLGVAAERTLLRRLYELNDLYQVLLTFGIALVIEGTLLVTYGSSGLPYDNPMPGGVNLGFMVLAASGKSYPLLYAVIGAENLCGGMGTAAYVALLMALCDRRYSATQYALLSALSAVGRVYVGPAAG